jgi:hypothetical protein
MINFFRKIRKRLLRESKFSRYLLYAIGEIALVMIGILLALQVNDWNEVRKQHAQEAKLYESLLESLTADSIDVLRIHGFVEDGIRAQHFLISNSYEELVEKTTLQGLRDSIEQTTWVASSFFPRFSAYHQITNNGYLALIRSEEIKSKLVELYDRRYHRYQHIDASIDQKSEFHYEPIIAADLLIFHPEYGIQSSDQFDFARFQAHYPALKRECISILTTSNYVENSLAACQESIHELLSLIRGELAHSNP